jgi:hypothetical protein
VEVKVCKRHKHERYLKYCRSCHAEAERLRRAKTPFAIRTAKGRAYYEANAKRISTMRSARRETHLTAKFNELKTAATARGWPFSLEPEFFVILYDEDTCPICELPFVPRGEDRDRWPSIDRLNPVIGYTNENAVKICYGCNRKKNDSTPEQLRRIADWIEEETRLRNEVMAQASNGQ